MNTLFFRLLSHEDKAAALSRSGRRRERGPRPQPRGPCREPGVLPPGAWLALCLLGERAHPTTVY